MKNALPKNTLYNLKEPTLMPFKDITLRSNMQQKLSPKHSEQKKMFQRKTSFKAFERKPTCVEETSAKLVYISPEKSDIFRKHAANSDNISDFGCSKITDLSSKMTNRSVLSLCINQMGQSSNDRLYVKENTSRQFFRQKTNFPIRQKFKTPKTGSQKFNHQSIFGNQSRRDSILTVQTQSIDLNKQNNSEILAFNFTNEADSIIGLQSLSSCSKSFKTFKSNNYSRQSNQTNPRCQTNTTRYQTKGRYQTNAKSQFNSQQKIKMMQSEAILLKLQNTKLRAQKRQIQQSSKLFLEEIKNLQQIKQNLQHKNEKLQQEIETITNERQILFIEIEKKNNEITGIQKSLISPRKISNFEKSMIEGQIQMRTHFQNLYTRVNQQLKYMTIENDMIKKQLDENNKYQLTIQTLKNINKKLKSQNKYLLKQVQSYQKQSVVSKHRQMRAKRSPKRKSSKLSDCRIDFPTGKQNEMSKFGLKAQHQQVNNTIEFDSVSVLSFDSDSSIDFELSPTKEKDQME